MTEPTQHQTSIIHARGWFGRAAVPGSATCTTNGFREGIWRRDPVLGWVEDSAMLRPVAGFRVDEWGVLWTLVRRAGPGCDVPTCSRWLCLIGATPRPPQLGG